MSSFKLHIVNGYISNLYIAEYEDKLLLLDCGTKNDVERIKIFCEKKLNRSIKNIKLAIATHNHPDHSGAAHPLRTLHNIPIAADRNIDLWYKGASGFIQHKIDCILAHVVRRANRKRLQPVVFNRFVKPDIIISDNKTVPGFSDWLVFHVPGHTTHDVVLYNKEQKLLYSSDCIINVRGRYNLPIPVFFRYRMKKSFQKLMKLDIKTILPAHGEIIQTEKPQDVFQQMITLLGSPKSDMAKKIQAISIFAPQVWKEYLKKIKDKYKTAS